MVTVKLIFTAEVAESAEKRKNIFVKTSASSAFSAVKKKTGKKRGRWVRMSERQWSFGKLI